MLLFRSEEHVRRWLSRSGLEPGGYLTLDQGWRLAERWYRRRMDADWRRFTAEEAQAIFSSLGLTGPFWQLT